MAIGNVHPPHLKQVAPFGEWDSPIAPRDMATGGLQLLSPAYASNGSLFWLEGRPTDAGRVVVVERTVGGLVRDWTKSPFNVRSRVHEYGGGAYWLTQGEDGNPLLWFVDFVTQRVFRQAGSDRDPVGVTEETAARHRYADGVVTPNGDWIVAVRERHEGEQATDVVNELVAFRTDGTPGTHLVAGGLGNHGGRIPPADFVACPTVSPDGTRIAWVAWDHPNMPWDDTSLWVADFDQVNAVVIGEPWLLAGGSGNGEAVTYPAWNSDGDLFAMTDRTGWWNLHRSTGGAEPLAAVWRVDQDCAGPMWGLGSAPYVLLPDGSAVVVALNGADGHVFRVDVQLGMAYAITLPVSQIQAPIASSGLKLALVASSPALPGSLLEFDLEDANPSSTVALVQQGAVQVASGSVSVGEPISFVTGDGARANALFYAPTSAEWVAPTGELPPVIVLSHGGPTSAVGSGYRLGIQFWTTRGFAIVDVNYRGSTGFGRDYRRALNGKWGETDVEDCISAVRFLAESRRIDPKRQCIMGGSAGGYTTLASLAFRPGVFAAGMSDYGIGDLEALAAHTHKFESRYLDTVVAPYPEGIETYRARSPLGHAGRMTTPLLLLQGEEDRVVPPDQARSMAKELDRRGVPHALVVFEGEGHGFRRGATIEASYQMKLSFLGQVLGFAPVGIDHNVTVLHHTRTS